MAQLVTIDRDTVVKTLHLDELAEVEDDAVQQAITMVCDEVNGYATACSQNPSIAPGACKVPAELVHSACVLIRKAINSKLPNTGDTLDDTTREHEYQTALAVLRAAASCELRISDYSEDESATVREDIITGSAPYMDFSRL